MVLPETLRENFMDEIIRIVLIHLYLFQNYALLARNVIDGKDRVENQVAENVDGDGNVFVQNLDIEADGLFAGESVHIAANRINLAGNISSRAALGAFEDH